MNQKILSMQELEGIESDIAHFNGCVSQFNVRFYGLLRLFENEEVVQSFYQSGFLGVAEKERIYALKKSIEKYINLLTNGSDSLFVTLNRYVREQKDLVSMQTRGYSISESISARRETNKKQKKI